MSLSAPYTIEFPFRRTVGPKIGSFRAKWRPERSGDLRDLWCFEPEAP